MANNSIEGNAFFTENIEREQELRAKWNYKHKDIIRRAAQLDKGFNNFTREDIAKTVSEIQLPSIATNYIITLSNRRKGSSSYQKNIQSVDHLKFGHSIVDIGIGNPKDDPRLAKPNTDLTPDPIMRPVDPKVKRLLYKKKPHLVDYLAERNKLSPKEKYYFSECTSWEYGWELQDSKLDLKSGRYGKRAELQKIMNGKVGPAPDPAYYGKPDEHSAFCFRLLLGDIASQWIVWTSTSVVLLAGIAAFVRSYLLKNSSKPLIDFNDQSKVEPGSERIHSSKLYQDPNQNELLHLFDESTQTLYDAFRQGLRESNNGNCLGWRPGPGKPYVWQNYEDTITRSQHFGSGLLNLGHHPGQVTLIGVFLKNCPQWVMVEQAAYCYSMVIVPLHENADAASCDYVIRQTQLSVVVCEDDAKANVILENITPTVKTIVTIKGVSLETYERAKSQGVTVLTFNEIETFGSRHVHPVIPPKPDDLCTICYTSGTTGMPKGVMLTHANLIACVCGVSVHLGDNKLRSSDVSLSFLPLSHMLERFWEQCIFIVGGSVGFYSGDIRNLTGDLVTLKPTVIPAVPRLLNKMYDRTQAAISTSKFKTLLFNLAMKAKQEELKRGIIRNNSIWDKLVFKDIRKSTGGRLRYMFVSSAPLAGSVLTFVRCALSCQIVESYGQTESTASMATTIWGEYVPDHVGPPIPCCKIKLVDVPEMNYYAAKNQGEICCRGANVFKGYYKDPQKTKETIDEDGWLHTGDIGQWLPNGTLRIIDRKKHIFKLSQGEYVAPEKIQNIYLRSQYVEQAYVYGESLKSWLVAVVVPVQDVIMNWAKDNGIQGSFEELCRTSRVKQVIMDSMLQCGKTAGLKHYEQVRDIYLHAETFSSANGLLTPTMKTKRPEVKAFFNKQLEQMYKHID